MQILFTASCLILNNLTLQNEHYWLLPFSTLRFSLRALELFASNWQALILVQPSSPVTRLVPGKFSTSEPSGIRLQYCNFIIIIINFVDRERQPFSKLCRQRREAAFYTSRLDRLSLTIAHLIPSPGTVYSVLFQPHNEGLYS